LNRKIIDREIKMKTARKYVIGIDVGTGSVRAGLFDLKGKREALAVAPIKIWRPQLDFVEQSSDDIWRVVCKTVRTALKDARIKPERVVGIGFDATCSLVVLDKDARPISVSPTDNPQQNIIVWMDHRAVGQAARINATRHRVLRYVGGKISPEMEPPKILWLKEHLPQTFKKAGYFMDLADFLGFRATGDDNRSLCTTVCKWTYQGHLSPNPGSKSIGRWDPTFWQEIGMGEFVKDGFARIGRLVRPMGEPMGSGLTEHSAKELGLRPGTAVAVGIIDAHAGGLGLMGIKTDTGTITAARIEKRLALICGTSTCHMTASREPYFIRGIWGPYYSAMIPGMWLTEGGQSATGALIDNIIFSHSRSQELAEEAKRRNKSVYELLEKILEGLAKRRGARFLAELTADRHILPYFHGNRSPRADATLRGIVTGLQLDDSVEELALHYISVMQAIAYGTRHIIEVMNASGYGIKEIFACGGGTKSNLYLREHADATGCSLILGKEPEAVLLGAGMLGAVAAGQYGDILTAMREMASVGEIIRPHKGKVARYHERKYQAFHYLYKVLMNLRKITKRGRNR
jgi:FGGY-family pentulose kinase